MLDGATSQWKRSDCGSSCDRPGRRVAGRDPHARVEVLTDGLEVDAGRERCDAARVERDPRRRNPRVRQKTITPTLTNSSRSIRGTTRSTAYWKGSGATGGLRLAQERARARRAARGSSRRYAARAGRRSRRRATHPGPGRPRRRSPRRSNTALQARVGRRQLGRERQQHVVGDQRERLIARGRPGRGRCGAGRARRRGRSARSRGARRAGSGCAGCGRRWS